MSRKILTVKDTFSLRRGLVVVGFKGEAFPDVRMGTKVEISRPDGTKISSQIVGIEMPELKSLPALIREREIGFLLKDVTKEDVPENSLITLPG